MTDPKQLTPKQIYYAIQEDRMSSAEFEAWLDKRTSEAQEFGYDLGWTEGYDEGYDVGTDQGTYC